MLAAREGVRGPGARGQADGEAARGAASSPICVLGSFAAAVIGGRGRVRRPVAVGRRAAAAPASAAQPPDEGTKHFVPQLGGPFEAPFPSEPQPITCYSTALRDRQDDALHEARRRGPDPAVARDGVGLAAGLRRRAPPGRLGRGAGARARQRRGRLDAGEPRRGSTACAGRCTRTCRSAGSTCERNGQTVRRFAVAIGQAGQPDARRAASRSPTSCG